MVSRYQRLSQSSWQDREALLVREVEETRPDGICAMIRRVLHVFWETRHPSFKRRIEILKSIWKGRGHGGVSRTEMEVDDSANWCFPPVFSKSMRRTVKEEEIKKKEEENQKGETVVFSRNLAISTILMAYVTCSGWHEPNDGSTGLASDSRSIGLRGSMSQSSSRILLGRPRAAAACRSLTCIAKIMSWVIVMEDRRRLT